jgi:serine/threonine protein kinase
MSNAGRNVKIIFGEALDCASPAEQAAYLDRACGGDTALRARVEALLQAYQGAGHFLQGPPAPADGSRTEALGTALGPYRLLEPLGEGGFGMVYRAEQQQPVRRRVALKVLRPGMDSREVIARFEAERQAFALMNHPNIARVLDAGEAPPAYAGGPPRPYFVMELVEGVPLTDFCDQERLTPRERLGLFTSVCRAVQHAHTKGIIHRDLKPSNVLVTRQDGLPVVKVIDFGIAKALDQRLTDKTLVTGVAQVIGTPLYMSPEQAEPGAVDVDTRSDIYSLGVLLYELLTGTTPFDRERLREASFDELRRIIREEEPPRPSTRLSTLGPAVVTLSEQRRTDPRQLSQLLRGELDWIVMKCLEKDRSRRYETADALARDVARYLADEPVEACPPSAGYPRRPGPGAGAARGGAEGRGPRQMGAGAGAAGPGPGGERPDRGSPGGPGAAGARGAGPGGEGPPARRRPGGRQPGPGGEGGRREPLRSRAGAAAVPGQALLRPQAGLLRGRDAGAAEQRPADAGPAAITRRVGCRLAGMLSVAGARIVSGSFGPLVLS